MLLSDLLPRLTLVLGGARSGKSRFAEKLLMTAPPPWTYLATAQAFDAEMHARIAEHQARRGPGWRTLEVPLDLAGALVGRPAAAQQTPLPLREGLGEGCHSSEAEFEARPRGGSPSACHPSPDPSLKGRGEDISFPPLSGGIATTPILVDCLTLWLTNLMLGEHDIDAAIDALDSALDQRRAPTILVASEVGLGIVPDNALARAFRDHAGRLNQRMAARADRVAFMVAGLEMRVK